MARTARAVVYVTYLKYPRLPTDEVRDETMRGYTEARTHLKDLLDAAARGRAATIRRESTTAAVVDADRRRRFLAALSPIRAQVVAETGGWSGRVPQRR